MITALFCLLILGFDRFGLNLCFPLEENVSREAFFQALEALVSWNLGST
uniref:Uncharacterized protein n=1 Tax=Rhizophora mucronata TaxID=61149 RepID=A0A2P2P3L6_RHIMU